MADPVVEKRKPCLDDFLLEEVIGEGSYGEVRIAIEKETGVKYAAKILNKRQIVRDNKIQYVNTEKAILNSLHHPNIARLHCTFQGKEDLYFILELCSAGDLMSQLKKTGAFEEECARFYAAEVLSAISYMHSKGIVHRDVKPENVLLGPSMHAKLSDFGCAKELGSIIARSKSFCGTAEYICPELLVEKSAGVQADMWSFGCMIYQLLTGRLPFKGFNDYATFQAIIKNEFYLPEWLSDVAIDFIKKLMVADPSERLTAEQAKQHPFFEGIVWETIHLQTPPPIASSPHYVPSTPSSPALALSPSQLLSPPQPLSPPQSPSLSPCPSPSMFATPFSPSVRPNLHPPPLALNPDASIPDITPSDAAATTTPNSSNENLSRTPSRTSSRTSFTRTSFESRNSFSSVGSISRSNSSSAFDYSSSVSPSSTPPQNADSHGPAPARKRLSSAARSLSATFVGNLVTSPSGTLERASSEQDSKPQWPFLKKGETALCTGPMHRRSGFVSRKRIIIITNRRLIVANPTTNEVKCSVDWNDKKFAAYAKNAKVLVLSTAMRKFTLVVDNSEAQQWVNIIKSHKSNNSGDNNNSNNNSNTNSSDEGHNNDNNIGSSHINAKTATTAVVAKTMSVVLQEA